VTYRLDRKHNTVIQAYCILIYGTECSVTRVMQTCRCTQFRNKSDYRKCTTRKRSATLHVDVYTTNNVGHIDIESQSKYLIKAHYAITTSLDFTHVDTKTDTAENGT